MIDVVIVDDEELSRERISLLLKDMTDFNVAAECSGGSEAVAAVENIKPGLIFLDIQMPGMNGFEVLEKMSGEIPEIIFVTAYDEFAIKAFEVNAIGYLLKPFSKKQFETVLQRAKERIKNKNTDESIASLLQIIDSQKNNKFIERFIVKTKGKIRFIPVDNIEYLRSEGNYIELNTNIGKHLVRESLSSVNEKLNPKKFLRIHRSFIIKIDSIKELQTHFNGEYIFIMNSGSKLKSGRNYKDAVEKNLLS